MEGGGSGVLFSITVSTLRQNYHGVGIKGYKYLYKDQPFAAKKKIKKKV